MRNRKQIVAEIARTRDTAKGKAILLAADFADVVNRHMTLGGVSEPELCDVSGKDKTIIIRIRRGDYDVEVGHLGAVLWALGVDLR